MNVMRFEELAVLSSRALEGIFRSAIMPPPETLVSYEWRGYNIASFTRLLGIQKFIKGFFLLNGRVEGYNIQAQQNGLTETWLYQPSAKTLKRYAFYIVTPVDPSSQDNLYPQALFLNYGASPRNPRLAVERPIRDYLAQPDPHNPNLLLGKAYLALGSWRVFSSFFVIERLRPTDWVP
jgi:hypothetical protein